MGGTVSDPKGGRPRVGVARRLEDDGYSRYHMRRDPEEREYREKDFRTNEELKSTVMRWASNKKIENGRAMKGDPMDCKEFSEQQQRQWEEQFWSWLCKTSDGQDGDEADIDYTAAEGKGKGGDSYTNYYNNRPMEVVVDGVTAEALLDFPPTGAWDYWTNSAPVTASLKAGENIIRLQYATAWPTNNGTLDESIGNENAWTGLTQVCQGDCDR